MCAVGVFSPLLLTAAGGRSVHVGLQASRKSQNIQCATPFEALAQYDAVRYSFETGASAKPRVLVLPPANYRVSPNAGLKGQQSTSMSAKGRQAGVVWVSV